MKKTIVMTIMITLLSGLFGCTKVTYEPKDGEFISCSYRYDGGMENFHYDITLTNNGKNGILSVEEGPHGKEKAKKYKVSKEAVDELIRMLDEAKAKEWKDLPDHTEEEPVLDGAIYDVDVYYAPIEYCSLRDKLRPEELWGFEQTIRNYLESLIP